MKTKTAIFGTMMMSALFNACSPRQEEPKYFNGNKSPHGSAATDTFSRFIPVDTANKMLESYLASINYTQNDTDLQSLIIDVNQLRRYIDTPNGLNITHLKLMFAHTLAYANSPKANTNAGYQSNALTIIIVGYDSSGNYVYFPQDQNMVLDYSQPCPPDCPPGEAGSALLTTAKNRK